MVVFNTWATARYNLGIRGVVVSWSRRSLEWRCSSAASPDARRVLSWFVFLWYRFYCRGLFALEACKSYCSKCLFCLTPVYAPTASATLHPFLYLPTSNVTFNLQQPESGITKRHFCNSTNVVQLLLKNLIFTVAVPGTVAFYIPLFVFSYGDIALSPFSIVGGLLVVIGCSIYLWCISDFNFAGRGTPAPIDPPKALVVKGLYRYSRNPMYVGVVLIIYGWSLLFLSGPIAIYGSIIFAAFHLRVLLYEEPHLQKTFGSEYGQYCSQVGRWITLNKKSAS